MLMCYAKNKNELNELAKAHFDDLRAKGFELVFRQHTYEYSEAKTKKE